MTRVATQTWSLVWWASPVCCGGVGKHASPSCPCRGLVLAHSSFCSSNNEAPAVCHGLQLVLFTSVHFLVQ